MIARHNKYTDRFLLAAGFVGGTAQVETVTAAGTITTAGNASVIVTGANIPGGSKTLAVAVALSDTAAQWGDKVRLALVADDTVSGQYIVSGSGVTIILTDRATRGNDATLNVALANGTCAGITSATTSANTTAGVAGTAQVSPPSIYEKITRNDRRLTVIQRSPQGDYLACIVEQNGTAFTATFSPLS
jgi:phage tail sheath gpL-like